MTDKNTQTIIAVVGLGYVGLPLAVEFGKHYQTLGFDLAASKIDSYRQCIDPTGEISTELLRSADKLQYSSEPSVLYEADVLIVAVPTPVDKANIPDFTALKGAATTVGQHMQKGATVVFESTVYPGATEEVCVPELEKASGLKWKKDFHVGYSPERVNPGDKTHTITQITKVVSGDDGPTLDLLTDLYSSIITAGVHRATSIKVAEAAKVIENTQRDLNIALMNELAMIFHKMDINTSDVLAAAGTKWNFLPFKPGLVGGHCIGVDPYYLTHKAEMLGYHPQVIKAGRRINDGMANYVAQEIVKKLILQGTNIKGAVVNVLGLTFKENCPDLRNSKVADLIAELQAFGCAVHVHDPLACPKEAYQEYGLELTAWTDLPQAEAVLATVPHSQYETLLSNALPSLLKEKGLFVDMKSAYQGLAEQWDYWAV